MKQTKTIIAAICRTLLGVVFVFSGVVKAIDPLGTVYKIEDYLKAFGGFFTDLLPMAEVAAWGQRQPSSGGLPQACSAWTP